MMCSDLRQKVQRSLATGAVPLMVNATCGTTVLGSYDPVESIADICDEYGMWLHVDVRLVLFQLN